MKIIKISSVNGLGKTKGVDKAPNEIIKSLENIYSNSFSRLISVNSLDLEEINLTGDLVKDNELIYKKSFESFGEGSRVCFLGGDHSMSYSTGRAFLDAVENAGNEACLIVFDAHPDLMEPIDNKIPTNEEWLRALIADGFKVENILLVGLRNSDISELEFMGKKIRRVSIEELMFDIEAKTDGIMEFSHGKDLYISFDIDFVDPAYAPGTSYCEPGGLSSKEFLYMIKRFVRMKNLRAIDIVEINPAKDFNGMTVKLGSKVLSEFL